MIIRSLSGVALAMVIVPGATAAVIDQNLVDRMQEAGPDGTVSALVYLNAQVDIATLSDQISDQGFRRAHRHAIIVEALQDMASGSQGPVLAQVEAFQVEGRVDSYRAFWLANVISVEARPGVISDLADRDDVGHIYLDYGIELIEPVKTGPVEQPGATSRGVVEEGLIAIRADEVWNDLGITGDGALVATLDTGVHGSHEALASRWAGLRPEYAGHPEWAFLDPYNGNHGNPYDSGSHGTHTMGTVCGGSPGAIIGVAPGAHWMSSAGIDQGGIAPTVTSAIQAFQWMADPDGDPGTVWDVPVSCSNSWGLTSGHGYPNCDETFWSYLDALEAAGCVVVFSAGNEGSGGLRRPADKATNDYQTCAVAAIDPHVSSYPIASFSSRGPTYCTPSGAAAIKPDISGPGVATYSSVPGGYSEYDGTSMASPHINGVVALMMEANPELEVEMIKEIIYSTALDLGSPNEDNDYGWGLVDAYEAVSVAMETVTLSWDYPDGRPVWLEPTGGAEIAITITGNESAPDPSTATLHIVAGGGTLDVQLVHDGGPNYRAVFPELECGLAVNYYFSVESTDGDLSYSPYSAPATTWSADAWSGYEESYADDFNTDLGWEVSAGALTGNWTRVVPSEGGDRCDPSSDSDGSGYCYVTGNSGDEDVDDGTTILYSPNMDASDDQATIDYDFWYSNGNSCNGADPQNDIFVVEISDNAGLNWYPLDTVGPTGSEVDGGWITRSYSVSDLSMVEPSDQMRLRFTCGDLNEASIVEAAVDNVRIGYHFCNDSNPCPGDLDGNGFIGVNDILYLIAAWGTPEGDVDGDGDTDVNDVLVLLGSFGQAC